MEELMAVWYEVWSALFNITEETEINTVPLTGLYIIEMWTSPMH